MTHVTYVTCVRRLRRLLIRAFAGKIIHCKRPSTLVNAILSFLQAAQAITNALMDEAKTMLAGFGRQLLNFHPNNTVLEVIIQPNVGKIVMFAGLLEQAIMAPSLWICLNDCPGRSMEWSLALRNSICCVAQWVQCPEFLDGSITLGHIGPGPALQHAQKMPLRIWGHGRSREVRKKWTISFLYIYIYIYIYREREILISI